MRIKINCLNRICSLSLVLFLVSSCVGSKDTDLLNLQLLLKTLEQKDSLNEEKSYVDVSDINKDLYDILYYKTKSVMSSVSANNTTNASQINFSVAKEESNNWNPIPASGKIEKKEDTSLVFSLKGVVVIGELNVEEAKKKNQKLSLKSIMGGEKEVRNFKYLVLSLSSKKSGKLKIEDSDITKLKNKKINFKKEPEVFVSDSVVEKVLEGKIKATTEDIFGYDVAEANLVKNLKDKLNAITSEQIKKLDGITENTNTYASDVSEPNFASNPYTINDLEGIEFTYAENSIQRDDSQGFLSYEVHLAVPRLKNGRQMQISYSGFKSTSEKQTKFNAITSADIKKLDGLNPDKNTYPQDVSEPKFTSNPYIINGLSGITIRYRENSRYETSWYVKYIADLSVSKLRKREISVFYYGLRSVNTEYGLYRDLNASTIKQIDNITPDQNVYPSTITPNFTSDFYNVNSHGISLKIRVSYVNGSIIQDDNQGFLSYKVKISFPAFKYWNTEREIRVDYTGFKKYITETAISAGSGVMDIKLTHRGDKIISAHNDGKVKIWDSTGSLLKTIIANNDYNRKKVYSVAVSHDDSKIVSGDEGLSIKIWDFNSGNLLREISPGYWPYSVAFSPDGTKIVAIGFNGRKVFKIFNVSDGSVFQTFQVNDNHVNDVKFSSDGTKVISGDGARKIKVWNVATGSLIKSINAGFSIYGLGISSDSSKIAAVGWFNGVKIYNITSGSLIKSLGSTPAGSASVRFFSNDEKILVGDYDNGNHLRIWKISDGSSKYWKAHSSGGIHAVLSSDEKQKIISGAANDGYIKIWEDTRGF